MDLLRLLPVKPDFYISSLKIFKSNKYQVIRVKTGRAVAIQDTKRQKKYLAQATIKLLRVSFLCHSGLKVLPYTYY